MVSPILASATRLIDAVRKPTSPADSSSTGRISGAKIPTCCTSYGRPLDMRRILVPGRTRPSIRRTYTTTPW